MRTKVWFFGILLSIFAQSSLGLAKCLKDRPDVHPKRQVHYMSQTLPIILESSDRISHDITTRIFKILLEEVLNYGKIQIYKGHGSMNTTVILNRLSGCNLSDCKNQLLVPQSMVNLELWQHAGFKVENWVHAGHIDNCGPLGPSGRFGWYVPNFIVEKLWVEKNIIVDHWRAFQREEILQYFDLTKQLKLTSLMFEDRQTHKYFCKYKECHNGILYHPDCINHEKHCATILTSYHDLDLGVLKHQIHKLNLLVNIAWIGSNLEEYVINRTLNKQPTLFFSWKPNVITASNNYTRIAFPVCKENPHNQPLNCDFEVNQLSKVSWSKLRTHAPEAFHVLNQMHFSQKQYEDVLQEYIHSHPNTDEMACDWVKHNKKVWSEWLPKDMSNKTKIFLGGMFSLTGPYWRGRGIVPGAMMALEAVNKNSSILADYSLELIVTDTQCAADVVMKTFIRFITNTTHKIAGILGPACSETVEPIAGVAKHFNTIIITYSAEGAILTNRLKYPYFFRTVPENNQYRYVYLELFKKFEWRQVSALTEDGQKYAEYISRLQNLLQSNGINMVANRKFPRDMHSQNMSQYLEELKKKNARIIIGDFFDYAARAVMCEAYKQGMTAREGYVWFLPHWYVPKWFDTDYYNSNNHSTKENVPCTTLEMIQAIDGHLSLVYSYFDDNNVITIENKTVADWKRRYNERVQMEGLKMSHHKHDIPYNAYASYAYDAVWVYALALDKLLKNDPTSLESISSDKTVTKYMHYLTLTDFQGVSGHIKFDGPNRLGLINIMQQIDNETRFVGTYRPVSNEEGSLDINEADIVWLTPDHKRPTDGRPDPDTCAIEGFRATLGVECEIAIVIANVLGVGLFGLLMLSCFIVFKRRYEKKVQAAKKRMEELGLMTACDLLSLDEWEMPRNQVVINRKLGEGAFGTVFGGEAFFEDKGWVAVAVKTLKIGSTIEEKLDFLSEAEMMKRFDHTNIVRLLGVCTRGEPAYTIMEFMLYGDLKTYLLARRQLTNQISKEAEEVSPQRLTSMALDVSRGLSYLAELKYVHRDIACRNCLVNYSRTVKIGDFGMTRPVYDSDYYRFNKKGMLPVRWMAPESLEEGIYTPASDVWSYGVLVYEIVTFGSFPYRGLSNNQVLDYVKTGNTLQVPEACNPQLETLLLLCWSYNPQRRPSAREIVEILANNSTLISPSLDAPVSSVAIERTDSLEMQLPERSSTLSFSQKSNLKLGRGSSNDQITQSFKDLTARSGSLTGDLSQGYYITPTKIVDIPRPSILPAANMRKDERHDSDYFSENSREMWQNVTSV